MGHGIVDQQGPEAEEDGHGAELHALGEGSGDEGGGDDGEHELVDHVGLMGDGGGVGGFGGEADSVEEEIIEAADEAVSVAEGEGITDQRPEDGDEAHHGKALHHGAEHVFSADEAAVEERQAGAGHEQDEGGGDQHPGVVAGRLCVGDGFLEGGDLGLGGRRLVCGGAGGLSR